MHQRSRTRQHRLHAPPSEIKHNNPSAKIIHYNILSSPNFNFEIINAYKNDNACNNDHTKDIRSVYGNNKERIPLFSNSRIRLKLLLATSLNPQKCQMFTHNKMNKHQSL